MKTSILLGASASAWLENKRAIQKAVVLCDANTAIHCLPHVTQLAGLPVHIIPAGEIAKNMESVEPLFDFLLEHQITRNDVLINLGGGVVCDLGGFAASIYKRGISFIHIPTTLLAMVDAAIGGKTAINFGALRNMIGTFALPEAVLIFPEMLNSLPEDEIRSGTAEMLKHAILNSESAFDTFVGQSLHELMSEAHILQSAYFKQDFIEGDLQDFGKRQLLNAGHTAAHALEAAFLDEGKPISHGFAVAAGLWIEADIALQLNLANPEFVITLKQFIGNRYPKIELNEFTINTALQLMHTDKKNSNSIVFCLPLDAGKVERHEISNQAIIFEALNSYANA